MISRNGKDVCADSPNLPISEGCEEQPTDAELNTWIAGFPIEPLATSTQLA